MKTIRKFAVPIVALFVVIFLVGFYFGRNTVEDAAVVTAETGEATEPDSIVTEVQDSQVEETEEVIEEEPAIEFPININTATAEEFEALPGIGPTLAERILAYREEYGRFSALEQVMDVDGIGEKTFEEIQDKITLGDAG